MDIFERLAASGLMNQPEFKMPEFENIKLVNPDKTERAKAAIRSAELLEETNRKFDKLSFDLTKEREDREKADRECQKYNDKQNKKSNRYAFWGIIVALVSLIIAVFATWAALSGFMLPSIQKNTQVNSYAETTEQNSEESKTSSK